MHPYVSHVESNVKQRVNVELGPKTIIIGDNGAGKSAITDSISLALTGKVEDVAGKSEVSQAIGLMVLKAAAEDEQLFARASITLPDTIVSAEWSAEGSTAKATKPKHRLPEGINESAITIRDLRSVLAKGQDAIRDMFVNAISGEIAFDDVMARLESEEAKDFYRESVHNRNTDGAPGQPEEPAIDTLDACIIEADKRKRNASSHAARLADMAPVENCPTQADLARARSALEAASKKRDEAAANFGEVRGSVQVKGIINTPIPKALATLITLLVHQVDHKREECPICATKKPASFFAERLKKARNKAAEITKQPSVPSAKNTSELDAAIAALNAAKDAEDLASTEFSNLCRAKEDFDNFQAARQQKVKAERANTLWKSIEVELTNVRDQLLAAGVSKLEQRVQTYLPPEDTFRIVLGAGERKVCYYGLERNGHVNVALSGGEELRVQIALASAFSKEGLNIVIPVDRSLSAKTLEAVMTATKDAPVQIIINTTTDAPEVEGWTRIVLGEL